MKFRVLFSLLGGLFFLLPLGGRAAAPQILTLPVSATNVLGEPFGFLVEADDINGDYIYQWRKNNVNIVNPDGMDGDFYKYQSITTDAGIYTCRITNSSGQSALSAPAVLTLWYPPVITNQPQSKVVAGGSNVTFTVQVNSSLVPTNFSYQWEQDGFPLDDDGVHVFGATTKTLTLTNVQSDDAGEYTVGIYNNAVNGAIPDVSLFDAPTVSTNATLTVVVPPSIDFQPESQEVVVGDYVLFYVVTSADTTDNDEYPLRYQWKRNGLNIPSATNEYYEIDAAANPGDAGDYTVVINNWAGSVTSDPATLIVDVPVAITVQPASANVLFSSTPYTNKVTISTYSTLPLEYQWYFNNDQIPDATNRTYAFVPSSTNQSGVYYVYVSNVVGGQFSDDAVVSVRSEFGEPTANFATGGAPSDGARLSNAVVAIRARGLDNVTDSPGIARLESWVNNDSPSVMGTETNYFASPYWTIYATNNITLVPGTNTVTVQATDVMGNKSVYDPPSNRRTYFYVVPSPFTLLINGAGTVSSNWTGGNMLELGRNYDLAATPASTNRFVKWSNSVTFATSTSTNLTFLMQSNLVITAYFAETNAPTLSITNPAANANLTNTGIVTVQGAASDNVQVTAVMWRLNNGNWLPAAGTTNWTAVVTPSYGSNQFRAYSVDAAGNCSPTNSLVFTNTSLGVLVVRTNGQGTILTNFNGSNLIFGLTYSMTAVTNAGSGYGFTNWTGGTNGVLSAMTNKATINFVMKSNLTLQANFSDMQNPGLVISNALPGGVLTSSATTIMGSAADNDRVVAVMYQINSGDWTTAVGTNAWTAAVNLVSGTNKFVAYSVDAWGNKSSFENTNSYVVLLDPPVVSLRRTNSQTFVLFNTVTGATYRLLSATSLVNSAWATNSTTNGTGGNVTVMDSNPPTSPYYYRVRADVP